MKFPEDIWKLLLIIEANRPGERSESVGMGSLAWLCDTATIALEELGRVIAERDELADEVRRLEAEADSLAPERAWYRQ